MTTRLFSRGGLRPASFFSAALIAAVSGLGAAPSAAPRATLRVDRFDFGTVRRGESIVHAFSVHNSGTGPLAFTKAELSMPGMSCRISPPIAPGGDGTILLEWKTAHVQGAAEGIAEIATNDPARPALRLTLTGRIEGPLEIEPLPAIFLSAFRGEEARRELTIRAHVAEPVSLSLAPPAGARFRAELAPLDAGKSWRLTVRPSPDAPPGRYEEELSIGSSDPAIGTVRLPVHLFVKPDLYANPDDLDFGEVSIARLRSHPEGLPFTAQTFFVKKRSGTFRITGLRSDVAALELRADPPSGAAESFQIDARLRGGALAAGSLGGRITVETDDPAFPVLTVRVEGRLGD